MGNEAMQPPEELLSLFQQRWQDDPSPDAFYEFLRTVEWLADSGKASREQVALVIAGTMFLPGVDTDPLREEITMVAGDLETGQEHPRHTWAYLLELTDELRRRLGQGED
jgi:hypothetical protein